MSMLVKYFEQHPGSVWAAQATTGLASIVAQSDILFALSFISGVMFIMINWGALERSKPVKRFVAWRKSRRSRK